MADQALPSPDILRQLLHYDADTGAMIWRERTPDFFPEAGHRAEHNAAKWNALWAGLPALSYQSRGGYLVGSIFHKKFLAHRVAFAICHDRWPTFVDHINGIRTDNRVINLREVSRRENQMNQRRNTTNTSGHMGVSFNNAAKKWVAYIKVGGQHLHLGSFSMMCDAITARKSAEKDHGFHENHGRG